MNNLGYNPSSHLDTGAMERVKAYSLDASFPCLGARSAINSDRAHFGSFGSLGSNTPSRVQALCDALATFSDTYPDPGERPVTYIAMFEDDVRDEQDFELRLWRQLQLLHDCDSLTSPWATDVSKEPESSSFSFSVAGRAFFIVGLHPQASRIARRSPVPCLAFNFHDQFEELRASGKYGKMQRLIRARDIALQGDVNPMLSGFGEGSEAKQYSGRAVGNEWRCPFRPGAMNAV